MSARHSETTVSLLTDLLELCHDDPDTFNSAVLGRPEYWQGQRSICEAVTRHSTVIVPTGNSVGKSYLAAGIALWWLYTRPGSLVACTAPSQTLLGTVLFKEIRKAKSKSRIRLFGHVTSSPGASPQEVRFNSEGWQILGIATKGVERLSGQHHANLLQIVDEGSGVEPEIWEALDSQNPEKRVVFGNPLRPDGRFKQDHDTALAQRRSNVPESQRIVSIPIPSTDSPDIDLERSPRGLADRKFLRDTERDYGKGSLFWITHVDAKFPSQSHELLIPSGWVGRCKDPGIIATAEALRSKGRGGKRVLSWDISTGSGADSSIHCVRDGLGILDWLESAFVGVPEGVALFAELMRQWDVQDEDAIYDAGGPGRDAPKYFQAHRISPTAYHGGAPTKGKWANRRTRVFWKLRQRLDPERPLDLDPDPPRPESVWDPIPALSKAKIQPPFAIPDHLFTERLRQELTGLRYELRGGKIALEEKEDFVKRLGRSPDAADALAMSFYASGD